MAALEIIDPVRMYSFFPSDVLDVVVWAETHCEEWAIQGRSSDPTFTLSYMRKWGDESLEPFLYMMQMQGGKMMLIRVPQK